MFGSGIVPDRQTLILGTILFAGLFWVAQDYPVFHALIGVCTVVAIWGVFVTAWNSRYIVGNAYFHFVGIAYLFVGLIQLLHILSYKGLAVFAGNTAQSVQLGIAARGLQAAVLAAAPLLTGRKSKISLFFAAFGAVSAALLLSIFYWRNFPTCFLEGTGSTACNAISECIIILLFLSSIFTLFLKRLQFDLSTLWALAASLALSTLAELAFALNTSFSLQTDEPGHFLRLIAVYLMYRVFMKAGIFAPFNRISKNLSVSEKNFFSLLEGLPAFVFVQMQDYTIRYANRVFRDLFGETAGKSCYEILKGEKVPCEICPTMEIFGTGVPQYRDWSLIDGKTYAIYEYPYRDLDDSPAVLKLGIDITDRKNMEIELIAARNELENRVRERTSQLSRTNEVLRSEVAERERAQEDLRRSEEELRLISLKLLHAQEMERKRIALELHDSLGGSISAIKFRTEHAVSQLGRSAGARSKPLFDDIITMLQNLLEEVRRIHSNIWPSVLNDFGLIMAVDWFCRKFEENYPHIHIEKTLSLDEAEAPDVLKIVIFRIIQEAFNNVAKHSGASLVTLGLEKQNAAVQMSIRDNGGGFDAAKARESAGVSAGVGLSSMAERARLSGGVLEIRSGETGTEISVRWPLKAICTQMCTAT